MEDAYWRVTDGLIHPVSLPPVPSKRPRTENDIPSGPEMPGHQSHNDGQGMHHVIRETDPIETSYERYLRSGQTSSYAGGESGRSMSNGVISHPTDGPRVGGAVGSEPDSARSRPIGFRGVRREVPLPPEPSNTLFVEGLPANCARREVSHIFRPFVGFKEVRLVFKESRYPGGHPFVLCFVDFVSPAHASTAMDTLQGYKLDQHDRDSPNLRLQFARRPRSGRYVDFQIEGDDLVSAGRRYVLDQKCCHLILKDKQGNHLAKAGRHLMKLNLKRYKVTYNTCCREGQNRRTCSNYLVQN